MREKKGCVIKYGGGRDGEKKVKMAPGLSFG